MTTYLSSLNAGLYDLVSSNERVIVLGEDIQDPYGGAFKVTKGLSDHFPSQVFNTPISESSIVGIGTGLAMQGFFPVVEIMFGDFMTLTVDQILNGASKFGLMYGKNVKVPLVVRTPMGGGRGYGPTHSQSIEKLFFGMPGVNVVSPSVAHDPGSLLKGSVINDDGVTIFVEYKNIYNSALISQDSNEGLQVFSIVDGNNELAVIDNFQDSKPDVVIFSYGGLSRDIVELAKDLIEEEINIRAIFPSLINDVPSSEEFKDLLNPNGAILIAELGAGKFGWGGEVIAGFLESGILNCNMNIKKISSSNNIIPASAELEKSNLIGKTQILEAIMDLMS